MSDPIQAITPRAPFDRRDLLGRRIVERREGHDQRYEIERRDQIVAMMIMERRTEKSRRMADERRNSDLRNALRREIPERRH